MEKDWYKIIHLKYQDLFEGPLVSLDDAQDSDGGADEIEEVSGED